MGHVDQFPNESVLIREFEISSNDAVQNTAKIRAGLVSRTVRPKMLTYRGKADHGGSLFPSAVYGFQSYN